MDHHGTRRTGELPLMAMKRVLLLTTIIFLGQLQAAQASEVFISPQAIQSQLDPAVSGLVIPTFRTYRGTTDIDTPGGILQFASLAAFRRYGPIDPGRTVMLDLEHWSFTPTQEQDHPRKTFAAFAVEAHDLNLVAIAAPSRGLARRSFCGDGPGKTALRRYLDCRWSRLGEDILLVQTQKIEETPLALRRFLAKVREQAPPGVEVWGELSLLDGGVTVEELLAARSAGSPYVTGWGLWTGIETDMTALSEFLITVNTT